MRIALAITALLTGVAAAPGAVQTSLDLPSVSEAVAIGQRAGPELARFHDAYRVVLATAPIDFVEVVTPFRRIVLEAQARAAAGDRRFGQRQALEVVRSMAGRIEVHVELTFHPLNTYVGVPAIEVSLVPVRGRGVTPVEVERVPRWTPRVSGFPLPGPTPRGGGSAPRGQPLLGGTVIARFALASLDADGVYDARIVEGGEPLGRATIRLAAMR
jgi:hypothetical protein